MFNPKPYRCCLLLLLSFLITTSCTTTGRTRIKPSSGEKQFISNIRQLTSQEMGLFKAGEAYFSPDEQTIIFQAFPEGQDAYQIYTLALQTGELRMVSTGRGKCTCAFFHPGGEKIIFASTHLNPDDPNGAKEDDGSYEWDFDEHMDIFEADIDGSHLRRLTDAPGYDAEGSYSQDGNHIVFCSKRDGDREIYIMNADGSSPRRVTKGKGYDGGPFFSPDGQSVLYRGDRRGDGELQIRMVDADGRNDRAITDNLIFNWCPYWHPSQESFIFTQANHNGRPNYDLFMMTSDGKRSKRITFDGAFDGLPVFNSDGSKLMWTSKRGGLDEAQVFIADFALPDEFSTTAR